MLNNVVLVGRLVKTPRIYTSVSTCKKECRVTLAVQRSYKNEEGYYDTDFITTIVQGNAVVSVSEYCKKGDIIAIHGRLETNLETNEILLMAHKLSCLQATNGQTDDDNYDEEI